MQTLRCLAASAALVCLSSTTLAAHHEGGEEMKDHDHKAVATGWWEASCGDLAGFTAYIKKHMADDGVFWPARYVGLGFNINNDEGDKFGMVERVLPDTPAAAILKKGDVFVSVNGMPMTYENREKTTFRGKPGEAVAAVIRRDGKEMTIAVTRGIIEAERSKETALEGLALADPENWGTGSCELLEVIQEGNIVYVAGESTDVERETGYEFTQITVGRMEFNDEGKISWVGNMSEDRFVLEQLGYTISR